MVSALVCPYCYDSFGPREVAFRCAGRPSPTGQVCERRRDDLLAARMGTTMAVPPAFPVRGARNAATCPGCGGETRHKLCPRCHSQLPVLFGAVDSKLIALVGAKNSGKTVYLTVLIHELTHRVGARFDAAVLGADDTTRVAFDREYEHRLYAEHALPAATRSAAATDNRRAPLVFRFTRERRRKSRHDLLSFFDTAGEDLVSQASVDLNARYLAAADGVILLLDPLKLRPGTDSNVDSPVSVLSRITDLMRQASRRPTARIDKPVAVAFSKLDTLWGDFPDGSPLRRPAADGRVYDRRDSRAVHDHVRALLDDWDGSRIDQILKHNVTRYRYFGLSALGEPPTADHRVAERGIRPYRVADPFLWLLAEFGTIDAKG